MTARHGEQPDNVDDSRDGKAQPAPSSTTKVNQVKFSSRVGYGGRNLPLLFAKEIIPLSSNSASNSEGENR